MAQAAQDGSALMPHGMCFLWEPDLLWLHVISDLATGVAYYAIPPALLALVVRARREVPEGARYAVRRLPHEWMFLAFGLFIVACGTTHFMAAWNVWNADYWASGGVKAVTALASLATAVALPPLIPRALRLIRDARESEVRRVRLEEANEELEVLNARLQEADELKSRFLANVSHELRTPLTLIRGPVERRLSTAPETDERRDLELVQRNARVLERRVDDLLDLARFEGGEAQLEPRSVDLSALVRETAARFAGLARERDVALELDIPDATPATVDPDKMERILDNLVTNAFKYAPDGGTIRIGLGNAVDHGDPAVALTVEDDGPGIPERERERVFDRFRQVEDPAYDRGAGSGLGLAIVREFALLHGGSVGVADSPLGGALLEVVLPAGPAGDVSVAPDPAPDIVSPLEPHVPGAADPEVAATGRVPAAEDEEQEAGSSLGAGNESARSSVLVVEDTRDMRGFLARLLGEHHEVRTAANGRDALRILEGWVPDLLITDLMMPELGGQGLLAEIRNREGLEEVPVLVLSARGEDEARVALLRGGAQDYVTKPFSGAELLARARNLIAMKRVRDLLRRELVDATGDIQELASELGRRHRQLEQALQEVRTARDEAEAASRAKSEFLAVMSHELRTPLNAITGYVDLLEAGIAGPVSPEQRAHLIRIRVGARHLLAVIEDILTFTRDETGSGALEIETVRIPYLLDEVADVVRVDAERKGIDLAVDVPEGLTFATDREWLRRIATNLASNAVKFTDEGRIEMVARVPGDHLELRLLDTGIGLAPEHTERIFEPFWQVDQSSTRRVGGTGLGLSIVRRLVQQLGGDIAVESVPGEGTTFTVRIPRGAVGHTNPTEGQRTAT
jgi:signal transduction histidine kinase